MLYVFRVLEQPQITEEAP